MGVAIAEQHERMAAISAAHKIFVGEIREAVRQSLVPIHEKMRKTESSLNTVTDLLLEIKEQGEGKRADSAGHPEADRGNTD
jgi:hypothetical protein